MNEYTYHFTGFKFVLDKIHGNERLYNGSRRNTESRVVNARNTHLFNVVHFNIDENFVLEILHNKFLGTP